MNRDIDTIIQRMQTEHPAVEVEQLKVKWPADDDGIWYFKHPGCEFEIQIESTSGNCPFLIETDGRIFAQTVGEVLNILCKELDLTPFPDFC